MCILLRLKPLLQSTSHKTYSAMTQSGSAYATADRYVHAHVMKPHLRAKRSRMPFAAGAAGASGSVALEEGHRALKELEEDFESSDEGLLCSVSANICGPRMVEGVDHCSTRAQPKQTCAPQTTRVFTVISIYQQGVMTSSVPAWTVARRTLEWGRSQRLWRQDVRFATFVYSTQNVLVSAHIKARTHVGQLGGSRHWYTAVLQSRHDLKRKIPVTPVRNRFRFCQLLTSRDLIRPSSSA